MTKDDYKKLSEQRGGEILQLKTQLKHQINETDDARAELAVVQQEVSSLRERVAMLEGWQLRQRELDEQEQKMERMRYVANSA